MNAIGRDVVILSCAISAGIHGALVPDHLADSNAAGGAFAATAVLLAVLAVALTWYEKRWLAAAAGVVLAGLIGSYALAVTTGLPGLHPEREPVEGIALATKAIEALGLAAAAGLVRRRLRAGIAFDLPQPRGT